MSVLACHRKGCQNVMCDYYFPDIGYLCDLCVDELIDFILSSPSASTLMTYDTLTFDNIKDEVLDFMQTSIGEGRSHDYLKYMVSQLISNYKY